LIGTVCKLAGGLPKKIMSIVETKAIPKRVFLLKLFRLAVVGIIELPFFSIGQAGIGFHDNLKLIFSKLLPLFI
jgi:hypothetical protein